MHSLTASRKACHDITKFVTKLRARLKATTLETLALNKFMLMQTLKAKFAKAKRAAQLADIAAQHLWDDFG
jgi:hypothetical protein